MAYIIKPAVDKSNISDGKSTTERKCYVRISTISISNLLWKVMLELLVMKFIFVHGCKVHFAKFTNLATLYTNKENLLFLAKELTNDNITILKAVNIKNVKYEQEAKMIYPETRFKERNEPALNITENIIKYMMIGLGIFYHKSLTGGTASNLNGKRFPDDKEALADEI
uniref:Uncharacterized protein n=1 Tax=Glossina pallidipes TaxID=7398 RepID=A0A1A9ZN36_GLOPL